MAQLIKIADWPGKPRGHVIFVHGLGGHAYDTWRQGENDETFWPSWLARDIDGLTVWTLSYSAPATNWLGTAPPLQDRAVTVLELLLSRPELKNAPIAFVCHSLGGLVVKQMLRAANDQRDDRPAARALLDQVKAIVFIATPHTGSAHASWLDWFRLVFWPSNAAQDLVRNDANLRNLNVWYRNWSDKIANRIFYETQGTAAGTIVDPGSADAGLPGVVPVGIDADHVRICKPSSDDGLLYRSTRDFLANDVFARPKGRRRKSKGNSQAAVLPNLSFPRSRAWAPLALRLAILLLVVFVGLTGVYTILFPDASSPAIALAYGIVEKLTTPIGLAAIALLVMAAVFLGIVRRTQHQQRSVLIKSIARYSFIIGALFGLVAMANAIVDQWISAEYRVSGTVFDGDGRPLDFAEVTVVGGPTLETGADGNFELVLPRSRFADGYTLVVTDVRHETYKKEVKSKFSAPNLIHLKKIQTIPIEIDVTALRVGHIVGAPVVEVNLSLRNSNKFSRRLNSVSALITSPTSETFDLGSLRLTWSDPPVRPGRNYVYVKSSSTFRMNGWLKYGVPTGQVLNHRMNQELLRNPVNLDPSLEIQRLSSELTKDLQEYARRNFHLRAGKWELKIAAHISGGTAYRSFYFLLTESQIIGMQDIIADYQYGFGVLNGMLFAGKNGHKSLIRVVIKN